MTKNTRRTPMCDARYVMCNATVTTAVTGSTTALVSHVRHNTVVSRDLHGNIKLPKAVAVNADSGHKLDSTLACANTGEIAASLSCVNYDSDR